MFTVACQQRLGWEGLVFLYLCFCFIFTKGVFVGKIRGKTPVFFVNETYLIKTSCFHAKRQNTVKNSFFPRCCFCFKKERTSLGSDSFSRVGRVTVNKHFLKGLINMMVITKIVSLLYRGESNTLSV